MSGNRILIDTNIALYLFKGDQGLGSTLQDQEVYVSFVNELELLGYAGITTQEEIWIEIFLDECNIIDVNAGIKEITKRLRRRHTLKLPDAIVAATAIFLGIPLLSADKHFDGIEDLTFVRYEP